MAGVLIPVSATRHEEDYGIGDTHSLKQWIDWAARYRVGFLQLLPINEHGTEESPYSAISSTALDPIYLAINRQAIPWLSATDFSHFEAKAQSLRKLREVDYTRVRELKRTALELAWSRFDIAPSELQADFKSFKKSNAQWLDDYCLFRFLMECHGESKSWDQWPENCRTPDQARHYFRQQREIDQSNVDYRFNFPAFVQWLCFKQWADIRQHADRAGVKLMGDIPIGVAFHSCDVFFNRKDFDLNWYGGSPAEGHHPDDPFLSQWGQNWGGPLFRWEQMDEDGFRWWRNRIHNVTNLFHLFRLDHILGFYRLYGFPWNPRDNHKFVGRTHDEVASLTGGRLPRWWSRDDSTHEHRYANLKDGDHRLQAVLKDIDHSLVIAEDLGWVPDYVRPHLEKMGIAGFKIPHWDCDSQGHPTPPDQFPENSIATYSTHDHDPIQLVWKACWKTLDEHARQSPEHSHWQVDGARGTLRILCEFAGIPVTNPDHPPRYSESMRYCLIKALMSSRARLALLMVTELFDIDQRINEPGRSHDRNWTLRLPWTVSELEADPALSEVCNKLQIAISLGRRIPA